MSLKKGGGPKTLPWTLTLVGQGSSDKLNLVYHNRKTSEFQATLKTPGLTLGGVVPYLVESWDTDFPLTEEGVADFDDEYPGTVKAVIDGYHEARQKEAEKN